MDERSIGAGLGIGEEPSGRKTSLQDSLGRDGFCTAVRAGLPRFLEQVRASNPGNSSPYLTDATGFRQAFGSSLIRQQRLAALDQAFFDLKGVIDISCCLIGGSFVDPARPDPRDIDVVMFYRALEQPDHDPGRALSHLSRKFLLRGIDARFVPCDAEPWLLVKLASFFTSLYHSDRDQPGHQRGLVLLIPDAPIDGTRSTEPKDRRVSAAISDATQQGIAKDRSQ